MSLPKPYFEDKDTVVYNNRCEDILPHLGRFDLLLTDPPYGLGKKWNGGNFKGKNGNGKLWGEKCPDWDKNVVSQILINRCVSACGEAIIWGGNYYHLKPMGGWLVWDKVQVFHGADCELAWANCIPVTKTFRMSRIDAYQNKAESSKVHPTEKPLALMSWCLSFVPTAKTCLDPFGGSLTTAVACKLRGVHCTIIEQSEKYCEIGVERLRQGVLITA